MPDRLPFREGEWIDRTQPVAFRFEGKPYDGFLGDSLSATCQPWWVSSVPDELRFYEK